METNKEQYVKYLTSLYQTTCTGLQSIEEMMAKVEEEDFKTLLSDMYSGYDLISKECEMLAKSENIDLKDNNWFEKAKLWSSINMSTLMDKSSRKIAELMILGTVMGLVQCLKDYKDFEGVDKELSAICEKLKDFQEDNYQKLKKFI